MAVIGADDQVVVADLAQEPLQVVGFLGGDVEIIFPQRVGEHGPALPGQADFHFTEDVGHPLGAGFDESPAELGKTCRHFVFQKRVERGHNRELEGHQGVAVHGIVDGDAVVAGVQAYGEVELLGDFVKREEKAVRQIQFAFQAPQEYAAGAVFLTECQFVADLFGIGQGQQRRHQGPWQPPCGLAPDIGEPAVVTAAEGEIDIRRLGDGPKEEGREQDLDIDADLVHMVEPGLNVGQFP